MAKKSQTAKDNTRILAIALDIVNSLLRRNKGPLPEKSVSKLCDIVEEASEKVYNELPVKIRSSWDRSVEEMEKQIRKIEKQVLPKSIKKAKTNS